MGNSRKELPREATKYVTVGAAGYFIDISIFNILSILEYQWTATDLPILNKTISSVVAVAFTYLANSKWTFRRRTGSKAGASRVMKYGLVNLVGISITLLCLFVSRYILGFETLLADNISANLVGTFLALLFRFFATRHWVFVK